MEPIRAPLGLRPLDFELVYPILRYATALHVSVKKRLGVYMIIGTTKKSLLSVHLQLLFPVKSLFVTFFVCSVFQALFLRLLLVALMIVQAGNFLKFNRAAIAEQDLIPDLFGSSSIELWLLCTFR